MRWIVLMGMVLALAACQSPLATARWSALEGDDLVAITDDMAMQMMASPAVGRAIAAEGRLAVVILPVENHMTGEILPDGPAHAFVARLRARLAEAAPTAFLWIANRDTYHRMRDAEMEHVDPGPNPDAIQPRYTLTARFDSITKESLDRRSTYYLTVYTLTELATRDTLWTGKYEMKKAVVKGFLD